jgi:hypothetical protein
VPTSPSARRRFGSLALALAVFALQIAPVAATEIATDVWIYQYGDTVTVTGIDFGANETVEIVTTDPYTTEVDRGQAQTDEVGGFTYSFVLLSDVPGIYDVVATGLTSGLTASTQFDPPNFGATLVAGGISPSTVDYSDRVTFSGNFTCTDNSGPAANKCLASYTEITVNVQLNIGGFTTVATSTGQSASFAIPCATACTSPWSVQWQAGRFGTTSVVPGSYSVRANVSGLGTGTVNSNQVASGLTITSEDTSTEYLGDPSATEGTSLTLSADVDDLDGGIGMGNGVFSPDPSLAATDVVSFELLPNSGCSGSTLALVYADIDGDGTTTGSPTMDLTGIAAGSYYLSTAYNGTLAAFYGPSADCDEITIESADAEAPTNASVVINNGDAWTNNLNVTADISADDEVGIDRYRLAESQAGLDSAADVDVNPDDPTFSAADVAFMLTGGEATSKEVWLRVCDAADNCSDASDDIGLDTTAPVITDAGPTAPANGNGWYNTDVTNTFSLDADISGPDATCAAAFPGDSQTKTTTGEGVALNVTSDSCTDLAGNTATGVTSADFQVDQSAPTNITFVGGGIAEGDSYYFGFVPAGPTSCTADYDISGNAGCVVTGPSNGNLVGANRYTATATDRADNIGTRYLNYTVLAWELSGFRPPVDMGAVNVVKGGSTVPLKFEVFAGATELTDISAINQFVVQEIGCMSLDNIPVDPIEFVTTGGTALRYDGTDGEFIQNWKTPKSPGKCYRVTMWTDDGSSLSGLFKLK